LFYSKSAQKAGEATSRLLLTARGLMWRPARKIMDIKTREDFKKDIAYQNHCTVLEESHVCLGKEK
jgi:hypothetical protein